VNVQKGQLVEPFAAPFSKASYINQRCKQKFTLLAQRFLALKI
jgi:hypothetical protein